MKFCRDCEYYEEYNNLCQSPLNPIDLVSGSVMQLRAYRAREDEELCGNKAVFWQSKQKELDHKLKELENWYE